MTTITKHAKCTRWAVLALAILLCAGLFAGCKRQEQENPTGTNPSDSTGGTTDTGDSLYDEDGYLKGRLDSGLDFSGMTDAEGNQVAAEDVADDADYTLVAVTGPTRMVVDGKVRYVSAGVTLVDENTVTTSEDTTEYVIFH